MCPDAGVLFALGCRKAGWIQVLPGMMFLMLWWSLTFLAPKTFSWWRVGTAQCALWVCFLLRIRMKIFWRLGQNDLTHLPYQAWSPACVRGKARPDVHKQDQTRGINREHTTISFDLCYTGKRRAETALLRIRIAKQEGGIFLPENNLLGHVCWTTFEKILV